MHHLFYREYISKHAIKLFSSISTDPSTEFPHFALKDKT